MRCTSGRILCTTNIQVHVLNQYYVWLCSFCWLSGSIVGFSNLGDLNSQLSDFEKSLDEGSEGQEPLANSMLVVMVRGLFSKFQFAYAQFPCSKLYGYQLYDIFWEAVERLERCGFRVIACTCDGLSVNRRFFSMHGPRTEFLHKVENPFSSDGRFLFFFSDPPHLIKTVRNCWSSQKRLLWVSANCFMYISTSVVYYIE